MFKTNRYFVVVNLVPNWSGFFFVPSVELRSPANMLQELQRSVTAPVRAGKTCVGPIISFTAATL
jgi:hypothetical protein